MAKAQQQWTDGQAETVGAEIARCCDVLDELSERFGDGQSVVRVRASLRGLVRQAEKALLATGSPATVKAAPKRKASKAAAKPKATPQAKPTTGAPALDNLLLAMLPAETPKATKIVPTKRVAAAGPSTKRRKPRKSTKLAKRSLKGRVTAGDGTWIDPMAVSADGRYRRHGVARTATGMHLSVRLALAVDGTRVAAKVKRPGEAPVFGHVMSDADGFVFAPVAS